MRRQKTLIEAYADVVCPWCYVGEKRLARALAQRPDLGVERRWRPFQLRPEMPEDGLGARRPAPSWPVTPAQRTCGRASGPPRNSA